MQGCCLSVSFFHSLPPLCSFLSLPVSFSPFSPSFAPLPSPPLNWYRGTKSTKTVKHFKRIPEGSHQHDMMKHAAATLGSGNLRLAVQLPEGEDLNEWIAVNSECDCAVPSCYIRTCPSLPPHL